MRISRPGSAVVLFGVAAVVTVLFLTGPAAATGSGYSQSFTRSTDSTLPADVDLTAVSSSYSSGPNVTLSFSVAGTVITNDATYSYAFWIDGSWSGNATAAIGIGNQSLTAHSLASVDTYSGGNFHPQPPIPYQVGGGTLTVSVATSLVGPSSTFAVNVVASHYAPQSPSSTNWLGTDYTGGGGGGTGTTPGGSSAPIPIGEIIWPVVIVVIVVIVILLVIRRGKRQQTHPGMPPTSTPQTGGNTPPPPPS